MKENIFTMV